jgi:hypothetical protein
MTELTDQLLLDCLAESLETMAFLSLEPVEEIPASAPADAMCVRIASREETTANLELIAPKSLGDVLAVNMLGLEVGEAVSADQATDALKELTNILGGLLLRRSASETELCLPELTPFDAKDWKALTTDPAAVVVSVEAHLIVVRRSA